MINKDKQMVIKIKDIMIFLIVPMITFYLLEGCMYIPLFYMAKKIQLCNILFYEIITIILLFILGKAKYALRVLLVFFGEHQPDTEMFEDIMKLKNLDLESMSKEQHENQYKVPYFIWSNRKIEKKTDNELSLNYLND